jgi:hypothetical protein
MAIRNLVGIYYYGLPGKANVDLLQAQHAEHEGNSLLQARRPAFAFIRLDDKLAYCLYAYREGCCCIYNTT